MSTWKTKLKAVLVGLSLGLVGLVSSARAATSDTVYVTVTVDVVSISIATTSWAIGSISAGSVNISSAIPVLNDGNRQEDYAISHNYGGSWVVSADQTAGSNEFVLLALFTTTPVSSLTDGMFGEGGTGDDVITTGSSNASATQYARTAEATSVKGFDVALSEYRDLYLNFRAPTSNTLTAQQSMTVTVTASAG